MLYADGAPVAGHLGLRQGSVIAAWFPAYDTAFRRYSPGLLQHLAMAHDAAADGVEVIDLGRGDKTYKDELKTREITVAEGRVTRAVPSAAVNWLRAGPRPTPAPHRAGEPAPLPLRGPGPACRRPRPRRARPRRA